MLVPLLTGQAFRKLHLRLRNGVNDSSTERDSLLRAQVYLIKRPAVDSFHQQITQADALSFALKELIYCGHVKSVAEHAMRETLIPSLFCCNAYANLLHGSGAQRHDRIPVSCACNSLSCTSRSYDSLLSSRKRAGGHPGCTAQ